MNELKPCPFCGSEAKRWVELDREQCVRCGALGPEYGASDAGWNNRVSPWRSLKDDPPEDGKIVLCKTDFRNPEVHLFDKDWRGYELILVNRYTRERLSMFEVYMEVPG